MCQTRRLYLNQTIQKLYWQSQLAKLLATEDLVVEHKKVPTACFNVHTRVLTLPLWEHVSPETVHHLQGHEVGHALYTPPELWFDNADAKGKIYTGFMNVIEDHINQIKTNDYVTSN